MSITGSCRLCGDCCRIISAFYPVNPDIVEWVNARGLQCVQISQGKKAYLEVHIPHTCKNLIQRKYESKVVPLFGKREAKYEYACRLQGNKPKVCSMYPSKQFKRMLEGVGLKLQDSLSKKCGYKVEDRNNGNG